MLPSFPVGDTLTAVVGVVGTLAACYHRDARGGGGQHVDVSMYEPVLALLSGVAAGWDGSGPAPMRSGSRLAGGGPRNVYRASDECWLVVSATTDAQAGRVLGLLGRDDAVHRERFATSQARIAHADELDALVADWIAHRPRHEVLAAFEAQRIPAAPVNDLADLAADPHVCARGSLQVVDDDVLGPVTMVSPAPRLQGTPGRIRHLGAEMGAHNDEVYAEWLSLGSEERAGLRERGVI